MPIDPFQTDTKIVEHKQECSAARIRNPPSQDSCLPAPLVVITVQFIPRKLAFTVDGTEEEVAHTDLLRRSENLIILGEAGSGKTWLLHELEKSGLTRVTARRLMNAPAGVLQGQQRVLVDAIDEAPAFAEGGVVDQVLAKLERDSVERFIIACRAEDWQAATATSIITETYGEPPLELHLKAFDAKQTLDFLSSQLGLEHAEKIVSSYNDRGLADWLGNPQTLTMLADVARSGDHPATTSALFQAYIDLCLREANDVRREKQNEVPRQVALDTLGAAFAALILSGRAALARPGAQFSNEDLRLAELTDLPGFMDWGRGFG